MSGKCIGIKQCATLLHIIRNKSAFQDKADFLRRSLCGGTSGKSNYNVCCATNDFLQNENIKLLPDVETCGLNTLGKVFGGATADLGEYPWMALLTYSKNGNDVSNDVLNEETEGIFGCGGVIINNRYVLTAAHCVVTIPETFNLKLKDVRLGEYDVDNKKDCIIVGPTAPLYCSDEVVDVPIEQAIAHDQYEFNKVKPWNDIALLRMSRHIEYTEYIKPICLPTSPYHLLEEYIGHRLSVAGWGFVNSTHRASVLQKVQVPVRSNAWCIKRYKEMNLMTMKQICAGGEEGKDSCNGDSGGPLMHYASDSEGNVNWYAAGIVSFGASRCGTRGVPGVYTRVNSYMGWIVGNLRP